MSPASSTNDSPPPVPRKSTARRLITICFLLAVCGALLIPGWYQLLKYHEKGIWQAYEKEAAQRGVKLDFADFIPPKIPDGENFASLPIFEAVFQASDKGQEISNPFKLPSTGAGSRPDFSDLRRQKRLNLTAWQKHFVEVKMIPSASDNAAADALQATEHFMRPLAELQQGAARPHCSFPVHWEKGWNAALPHLNLLQDATKLHALRMAAHLAQGDHSVAYKDFHAGLQLVTAIQSEPAIIGGMVRASDAGMMLGALWDGLAARAWTDSELRQIETDLATLNWVADYRFALSGDRASTSDLFAALIAEPRTLGKVAECSNMPGGTLTNHWGYLFYPAGWHYASQLRLNHYYDQLLARADPTQRRWFLDRPTPSAPENIQDSTRKIQRLAFMLMAPVLKQVELTYLQIAAITDQARLACALERFRLQHGSFPDALADLVPDFLAKLPADIVNGEPYHYRRTVDGSFVLYSVGADLHDDGGIIDPKLSPSRQPDWIWSYPSKDPHSS